MWKTFYSLSLSMLLRTKSQQQLTNKKKDSIFFNKKSMFLCGGHHRCVYRLDNLIVTGSGGWLN